MRSEVALWGFILWHSAYLARLKTRLLMII